MLRQCTAIKRLTPLPCQDMDRNNYALTLPAALIWSFITLALTVYVCDTKWRMLGFVLNQESKSVVSTLDKVVGTLPRIGAAPAPQGWRR